jgi:hypothetical protein
MRIARRVASAIMIYSAKSTRGFRLIAWLFAALTGMFLACVTLRIGGGRTADAVDDVGELVAALVSAAACMAAARMQRRTRAGWAFLAVSSFTWACGEALWCYYDLVRGVVVPFPSLADVGFLGAVPMTVVGLLAFSGGTNRSTRRLLKLAAEMFAGFAVFFAGWATLAGLISHQPVDAILSPLVGMTYPTSDLVISAMVVVAFRRATRDRVSLGLVLAGILSFTIADSSFAYFTATNSYGIGNGLDTGWVLGYLLVALGAMWAIQQRRLADSSDASTPAAVFASRALATVGAPGLSVERRDIVRTAHVESARFTHFIADRIVSGVALLLIVADAALSLHDLALMLNVFA